MTSGKKKGQHDNSGEKLPVPPPESAASSVGETADGGGTMPTEILPDMPGTPPEGDALAGAQPEEIAGAYRTLPFVGEENPVAQGPSEEVEFEEIEADKDTGGLDERTRVDSEFGKWFQESPSLDGPLQADDLKAGSSDVLDNAAVPLEPAAGTGAPSKSIEDLGPAFPSTDGGERVGAFALPIGTDASISSSELPSPTAAFPGIEPSQPMTDMPGVSEKGGAEPDAEDGWAGFEDQSGWSGVTAEGSGLLPSSAALGEPAQGPCAESDDREPSDARASVRLICIAGKDEGQEFAVKGREVGIGRVSSNDIVLVDPSVSREHARLLDQGNNFAIIDLRSANGTFVNGERIDRKAVRSGDEVGFGNTRFRFVESGDVFKPVDASSSPVLPGPRADLWQRLQGSPHFKSVLISVGILFVTLAMTITILALRGGGPAAHAQDDIVFRYYLKGVEAFKRHQWAEAETQFSIVLGLDASHERAQRYINEIGREKKLEQQLAAARAGRAAGDLAGAYERAAAIVDSIFTPEARGIMRDIDAELDTRVARARSALDAGTPKEALQLLKEVEEVLPGRPDVRALRERVAWALGTRPVPDPEPRKAARTAPARSLLTNDSPRQRTASPAGRAVRLFGDGKVDEAKKVLGSSGGGREARILRTKIEEFRRVYEAACEEHRGKRAQSAIKALSQAKALEAKISGGRSKLADQIRYKIADMYYVQGVGPFLAKQYPEAYKSFRAAIEQAPNHRQSRRMLDELANKAKEIFEEGHRAKDTAPQTARERWLLVVRITPAKNEYHRKARAGLDALP